MQIRLCGACAVLLLGGCAQKSRTAVRASVPAMPQPSMQRQVLNAVDAGEGNARVRGLRQQVAARPEHLDVRLELADLYDETGYPELALEHRRLASERFPDSELALRTLARALIRGHQPVEAARRISIYLDRHTSPSSTILAWAGIAFDEAGQYAEGEAMHRRAIGGDPHRDFLHNNLGYNLWMQGRRMEAAGCFRKALELNPGSENARNNLGMALADRPEEALSHFRQAADLGVAHNNLAALRFETGDLDGARRELELALQYRQDMPQILENLKRVAAMDGKPVVIPPAKSVSVWRSFARGMKQAFLTGEQKKDGQTAAESAR